MRQSGSLINVPTYEYKIIPFRQTRTVHSWKEVLNIFFTKVGARKHSLMTSFWKDRRSCTSVAAKKAQSSGGIKISLKFGDTLFNRNQKFTSRYKMDSSEGG